ncbi:MAG: hypothetical protein IID37_15380, partial [Planctomycetes bacterium]|nr:hypothetical protein [Planctomycetota bacterium]
MVICRVRNADLVRELGQFMYQDLMLHGNATWIRHNWRLKTMVIDSFDPPRTGSILEILRKTHKAGGDAWDAVENPEGLLEEMRET